MIGLIGYVGRVGAIGGARYVPAPPQGQPDFTLSGTAVATGWSNVMVGTLTPINAPAGAYFVLCWLKAPPRAVTKLALQW
jgi:hypothetical protein